MIQVRCLNEQGLQLFAQWLEAPGNDVPPAVLLDGEDHTQPFLEAEIDSSLLFTSRYVFGEYLVKALGVDEFSVLMERPADGMWAWLAVAYFNQIAKRKDGAVQNAANFLVTRSGPRGTLEYRQCPRLCYELVAQHGVFAKVCLLKDMKTHGEMAEQLANQQALARNKAVFEVACKLYMRGDRVLANAAGRLVPRKNWTPGNTQGLGSARRFSTRLSRLMLLYDIDSMSSDEIIGLLPAEFDGFRPMESQRSGVDNPEIEEAQAG